MGILVTHVSFQTGTGWGILERFDYFVAVFFALSAFVLWRRPLASHYYLRRFSRIAPAYLVCVLVVILALPDAHFMSPQQILANLTMTQIYVPDGLAPGLTHLWSLCIEVAFYLALPVLLLARGRKGLIVGVSALSLGWGWVPELDAVNSQIWPPAYGLWFAVGIIAAELEGRVRIRGREIWWLAALGVAWLASREWVGPRGLVHPEPHEFAVRVLLGGVFAALVVWPIALNPPGAKHWLNSPAMQALGRWSYSIFLWHVAALSLAFPTLGVSLFSGYWLDFVTILAATVAITIPVSAVSFALVEQPAQQWLRNTAPQLIQNLRHNPPTATEPATKTHPQDQTSPQTTQAPES